MSSRRVMVYASQAAAAARLHKYAHPVDVVEKMWRRENGGALYQTARAAVIASGQSAGTVGTAEERIAALSRTNRRLDRALRDAVPEITRRAVADEVTLETAVREAAKVAEDVVRQTRATEAPGTNVTPEEVVEYVRRRVHTEYGTRKEAEAVRRIEEAKQKPVTDNNSEFYSANGLLKGDGWVLSLGGRIDGLVDGRLVEIKNRRSRFMSPLPLYDVVQVHCYMHMLGLQESLLVEQLRNSKAKGTRTKETTVAWDDDLWENRVLPGLHKFAAAYAKFVDDTEAQQKLRSLAAAEEKAYWWDAYSNYDEFEGMPVSER